MLLNSDAARIPLADKSVHCVVTSPPYWGLRKYSGEQGRGMFPNLGLEPTPQEFVHNMVMIFREVRRVLRDDGVVWINLGDSFAGGGIGGGRPGDKQWTNLGSRIDRPVATISAGNLMLMPHRVAIALQDDGWIVRNDLVWYKRNPMPESVNGWRFSEKSCGCMTERREAIIADAMEREGTPRHRTTGGPSTWNEPADPDCSKCNGTGKLNGSQLRKGSFRHTRAHEYIFQLVKSMGYWSNQEAVREAATYGENLPTFRGGGSYTNNQSFNNSEIVRADTAGIERPKTSGRNPRSVLDVPTAPYKGSHYATFPPNLIAPLIRATCPRWACPVCGQGWSPVVEKQAPPIEVRPQTSKPTDGNVNRGFNKGGKKYGSGQKVQDWLDAHPPQIKEYRPTCEHPHTIEEAIPGIVLDPFIGSGTTGAVARELQLRWIGLDISMEYIDLQAKVRTKSGSPSNELENLPLFERTNP